MSESRRILITGASGWTGRHLSALALDRGACVFGTVHTGSVMPGVTGQMVDLTQPSTVDAAVADSRPDWVFHLGGLIPNSRPGITGQDFLNVNIAGTFNLLDAVRRLSPAARVLVASSSAVYGQPDRSGKPITEDAPLRPQSVYAASKAAQDMLAATFFHEHGLHTVRGRTFNQTGPGEGTNLVCGALAQQVARIEAGLQEPVLRSFTLAPSRDFSDVRDVVSGYWAALDHGAVGEAYNICSGHSVSISSVAEILIGLSSVNDIKIVETGPQPGPGAVLNQVGSAARLTECSGWTPTIPLERGIADLLQGWRKEVPNPAVKTG